MNEQEWLTSDEPAAMLALFRRTDGYPARPPFPCLSDRKLRLFACACVRQVWHLLADGHSRRAVEVAERYADGLASDEDVRLAAELVSGEGDTGALLLGGPGSDERYAALMARCCLHEVGSMLPDIIHSGRVKNWQAAQAALLREVVGNPFRPVVLPSEKRTRNVASVGAATGSPMAKMGVTWWECPWLTPTVRDLAGTAYGEKLAGGHLDPTRLAILADALEEAGCVDDAVLAARQHATMGGCCNRFADQMACDCLADAAPGPDGLLAHLRGSGPHPRGCWALDLVLGKE